MAAPAPDNAPEETLARAGALGSVIGAVLASAVAVAITDSTSAMAVAVGAALVAVLSVIAMPLYRMAAAAGNEMVVGMSLAALGLRAILAVVVFAIVYVTGVLPMKPFAIGLAAGLVSAIAAEIAAASRDPRYFWLSVPTSPQQGDPERPLT